MMSRTPLHSVPDLDDVPDAVERLMGAAERAAAARIDLATHGVAATAKTYSRSLALLALSAAAGVLAWIALTAGAVVLMSEALGWGWSLVIMGAVQIIVAIAIAIPALRTMVAVPVTPEQV